MSALFGEKETLVQANGPDVELRVFGDEFYARYETLAGHTSVYDEELGLFCYAMRGGDGQLLSSKVAVSMEPPNQIEPHLTPAAEARWRGLEKSFRETRPETNHFRDDRHLTFGPDNGLLSGRKLHSGTIWGLTVLVQFKDVTTSITGAEVDALMNAEAYTAHGNFCSVREYFRLMSGGALDYTNEVVGPVTLKNNRDFYAKNLLVREALEEAKKLGVDFTRFDSRGEGIVDAVTFLYAGKKIYRDELWPHNSVEEVTLDNVSTHFYMLTALGERSSELAIGTICHENGHMLCRFPDLYDYGKRDNDTDPSGGLGRYCLMSSGNHLDEGRTPAPISAYLRDLAGWCTTRVDLNPGGTFTANLGAYTEVLRFSGPRSNEYFLVENRSRIGLNAYCPDSGLAVYHCDIEGSNEWEDGTSRKHYQCALLQADGRFDLERISTKSEPSVNTGDSGDLYPQVAGIALSYTTTPSSRLWDRSDSGLSISGIGAPAQSINLTVVLPQAVQIASEGDSSVDVSRT
jgi:M6 family metalloprotease-like protein